MALESSAAAAALRVRLDRVQESLHDQSQLHMQLLDLLRKEGNRLGKDVLQRAASKLEDHNDPVLLSKVNQGVGIV